MLKEIRSEADYETRIKKVIQQLENAGYKDIRADVENYEKPAPLTNQADQSQFIPDITAVKNNSKHYFEISMKTEDEKRLAGKWNLLATLATMRDGVLKIFAPHGQMAFTNRLLKQFNINCEVAPMPA